MWSAAILVGGRARRLGGQPKGWLTVGGTTILARHLRLLGALGAASVVLVGRGSRSAPGPVPAVADAIDGGGALGGLYTALLVAPVSPVLVLSNDLPFVSEAFLRHLLLSSDGVDAVVPRSETGLHPLCAVYARRVAAVVKRRLDRGDMRVTDALDDMNVREVGSADLARFDRDGVLLMNVNTPDDYDRACRYADAGDRDRLRW
jgi:molybdopterin-guanine dinucleotide biosynthesis protein A